MLLKRLNSGYRPNPHLGFRASVDIEPAVVETEQNGEYRIQNTSAEGYLVYIGVNGPPDFDAAPAGFSLALPVTISWSLPSVDIETLQVVARYRDSYGCISQNIQPTIIRLSPTGRVLNTLPIPQNVLGYPRSNGNLAISGNYPTFSFEEDPADVFQVWVSTTGTPDLTAVPTYQIAVTGEALLASFGNYAPGTYYVAVALFRSADSARSGGVFLTIIVPALPGAPTVVYTENLKP